MKRYFIIFSTAVLSLTACADFLTEDNPNTLNSDTYFTDETSLEIFTNGFLRSFVTDSYTLQNGDANSDTFTWKAQAGYYRANYSPDEAGGWSSGDWARLREINWYLDNMRKAAASEEILNHYEGVGRFFRAWFYFEKVKLFGAVPWYGTSIAENDQEALFKDRDSREFVAQKILEDLNYACTYCLETSEFRSRATKISRYAALGLKARFCLFEGTMRKYHQNDPSTGKPWTKDESEMYLKECISACEDIMQNGGFSLTDNPAERQTQYRAFFTAADMCGTYANELLLARDYNAELSVYLSTNVNYVNSQYNGYALNRDFVNTYLMLDGTPFTDREDYNSIEFVEECKDRDYRLAQTIRTPGFKRDNGSTSWPPDLIYSNTGYQVIKYLTDNSSMDLNTSPNDLDSPVIRYSEILLSYAEAKAELGEMTEEVWNRTIKPLRERAGVTSIYPTEADPYMVEYFQNRVTDPFILEVRRERGIELVMENLRYYDIIRWRQGELFTRQWLGIYVPELEVPMDLDGDGTPDNVVTENTSVEGGLKYITVGANSEAGNILSEGDHGNLVPATKIERSWADYKYVRPIPTSALRENPNRTQNPEWDKVR